MRPAKAAGRAHNRGGEGRRGGESPGNYDSFWNAVLSVRWEARPFLALTKMSQLSWLSACTKFPSQRSIRIMPRQTSLISLPKCPPPTPRIMTLHRHEARKGGKLFMSSSHICPEASRWATTFYEKMLKRILGPPQPHPSSQLIGGYVI